MGLSNLSLRYRLISPSLGEVHCGRTIREAAHVFRNIITRMTFSSYPGMHRLVDNASCETLGTLDTKAAAQSVW